MLHLSFSFEYEDGGNFRMELHMTASSSRISPCPSPADPGSAAVVAHAALPSSGAGIVPLPSLLRSPCGIWAHLHTPPDHAFFVFCCAVTRQGVLSRARSER